MSIPRIGTIDDFDLQESVFKPRVEQFVKDRCAWTDGGVKGGVEQLYGNYYKG